jgi:hypothetical protein
MRCLKVTHPVHESAAFSGAFMGGNTEQFGSDRGGFRMISQMFG